MAKIKNQLSDSHKTKPKKVDKRSFERVYWPYLPLVLAISLLLGLGASGGSLAAYVRHPGGRVLSYATSMSISGLLADTNSARAGSGVSALSLNGKLDAAAQAKADDMAARNYWSHYTPDGNPPWVFVSAQNYSYQKLGENLATGFSDEQATIDGWMNSPPHRENLLDPSFKEVGFGFANNPNYTAAGGGPMTIIVAFYGNPQVLSAATQAPPQPQAPVSHQAVPVNSAAPAPTPTQNSPATPPPQEPPPESQQKTAQESSPNTRTSKSDLPPPVKQSRIQLALTNSRVSSAATAISVSAALVIFMFWITRHAVAMRKFLLKGERYAVKHPITDLGLLIIAALLFILSQTAGLIQ